MSLRAEDDTFSEVESDDDIAETQIAVEHRTVLNTPKKGCKRRKSVNKSADTDFLNEEDENESDVAHNVAQNVKSKKASEPVMMEIDDRICQQIIGETIAKTMKQLMEDGRLIMDKETTSPAPAHQFGKGVAARTADISKSRKDRVNGKPTNNLNSSHLSLSELTIYERAVRDDSYGINVGNDK